MSGALRALLAERRRALEAGSEPPELPDDLVMKLVVASEEDAFHTPLGVMGRTLYLHTTHGAPRGRIVAAEIGGGGGAAMAGNVFVGGIIGAGIDAGTGAMYEHKPNPLMVTLEKVDAVTPGAKP
jgi:hypothetical protein